MLISTSSIRITALRTIIPTSAITPSCATNPIGVPVGNIAMTTPIKPNGAIASARNIREKLRNCTINSTHITNAVIGRTAASDALPFAASSTAPPVAML
ncbi:hypothetical protein D3C77_700890 [compost metagenome]